MIMQCYIRVRLSSPAQHSTYQQSPLFRRADTKKWLPLAELLARVHRVRTKTQYHYKDHYFHLKDPEGVQTN